MTDFPQLQPAFHVRVRIGSPSLIGSASRGTPLTIVPITQGTMRNEPGFGVEVDGTIRGTGYDCIHNDPDGKHMRLDANVIVEYVFPGGSLWLLVRV